MREIYRGALPGDRGCRRLRPYVIAPVEVILVLYQKKLEKNER